MAFDLVIRNGEVVDGTGSPPFRADVAIQAGRIVEIGRPVGRGLREIDAEGHVVTPGFIDGHTHMDAQVFWDPIGSCACWHGVTSVVMGNCGFTLAPAHAESRNLVVANLEKAEDISADAMNAGIDWTWSSFPEYLDAVDAQPKAINYASQVGHSALRTFVMGERAFEETATEADLNAMLDALKIALAAGAIGFTTSISDHHETLGGMPVASRLATWEEISALVLAVGEAAGGIFQLATETSVTDSRDSEVAAEFYSRLKSLALASGVPVTFGMRRQHLDMQLDLFDNTANLGGNMFGQTRSEGFSQIISFKGHTPFDRLPVWRKVRSRPFAEQMFLLQDAQIRRQLIEIANGAAERARESYDAEAGLVPFPPFDVIEVFRYTDRRNPTVAELAIQSGRDPIELMIDLAVESNFSQTYGRFMSWSDEDMIKVMKHPKTVMTFSDAGAHVSSILSSSIQTRMFSYWVRDRQAFTLEEAVRLVTAVPAMVWELPDRGLLAEGSIADLNIFDPARIAPGIPTVELDLPTGAPRVRQKAEGFMSTIVNGIETLRFGEHTGHFPGRLLRHRGN